MSPKNRFKAKVNPVAEGAARAVIEAAIPNMNREQRRALANGGQSLADKLIEPPKDNTVWDDLEQMSIRCFQLLASPSALLPLLNNQKLMGKIENVAHLNRTASVLANDLGQFTTFYQGIRSKHQGKSGASTTPDDHFLAVMLHNDYIVFAEQFEANVRPIIESVTEQISRAEDLLRAEDAAEVDKLTSDVATHMAQNIGVNMVKEEPAMTPEQDPSVTTDVSFKETETAH